jgi:hypothetical protein
VYASRCGGSEQRMTTGSTESESSSVILAGGGDSVVIETAAGDGDFGFTPDSWSEGGERESLRERLPI